MDDPLTRAASPTGGTEPPPPDVIERLERRLRRETRGETLFDKASRGRYATECGQTVGAGLVIDHSKHFRQVLDIDATNRIAVVEGLLDQSLFS